MTVSITFYDRDNGLSKTQRAAFEDQAKGTVEAISARLPMPDIDVLILTTVNYSRGVYSFTGHTISPHVTMFFVDPGIDTLADYVTAFFPALLAHELHHCLRWPYFSKTIGEAIILEGMALRAERDLGFERRALGQAPDQAQMQAMFDKAQSEIDAPHDGSWIYSAPGGDGWSWIYHLGEYVVDLAFEAEGWDVFSQIDTPAPEIFAAAGRARSLKD